MLYNRCRSDKRKHAYSGAFRDYRSVHIVGDRFTNEVLQ